MGWNRSQVWQLALLSSVAAESEIELLRGEKPGLGVGV
jgi:hypothetical protein